MHRNGAPREPRNTDSEMEGQRMCPVESGFRRAQLKQRPRCLAAGEEIRNLMDHGKENLAVLLVGTCSLGVSLTAL